MAAALPGLATVPVLERLMQLDIVDVHQTSWGYNGNNYTVLSEDEPLFTMNEVVPDTFFRGGANRPFFFDGVDNTGRKFFWFHRPRQCCWGVSREVELFMNEQLTSVIRMDMSCLRPPFFTINDTLDQRVARLKRGFCERDIFQLQGNANVHIGGIYRKWSGWRRELLSLNDDFTINFPADLAVQYKMAVIVACVFIDFTFFEGK